MVSLKKICLILLALLFIGGGYTEVSAQLNRSQIRRNNHRMYTFEGRKRAFPKENTYNMIGISLNALNYYGDLAPGQGRFSTDFSQTRPAIGIVLARRIGPRHTITGAFTYGGIRGSDAASADPKDEIDAGRYFRNASFRNRIKELSFVASIDLWDNQNTYLTRLEWTPYAFGGVSIFHHSPQAKAPAFHVDGVTPMAEAGEWVNLRRLGTEGQHADLRETDVNYGIKTYSTIQFAIPFGIGVRYKLNQLMDLSFEFGARYTFTDYLDDVSQNYVDLGVFGDNHLARAMSYRSGEVEGASAKAKPYTSTVDGNTYYVVPGYGEEREDYIRGKKEQNDTYIVTTLKLTYIFGKTYNRAKFR
jgi:hypothetical protein